MNIHAGKVLLIWQWYMNQTVIVFDTCQQLKWWDQVELMAKIMNTVAFMNQLFCMYTVVLFKRMLLALSCFNVMTTQGSCIGGLYPNSISSCRSQLYLSLATFYLMIHGNKKMQNCENNSNKKLLAHTSNKATKRPFISYLLTQ